MTNCNFEPGINTTSATICKWCGKEKFMHNLIPEQLSIKPLTNNNMTPKEKAKELYNKYDNVLPDAGEISKFDVQQCALITVDDILNNFGFLTEGKQHYAAYYTIQYYEQVKQEIENL